MPRKRDYKKEALAEDRPDRVKQREARNKARAYEMKKGRVHKGDGMEVDHIRPIGAKGGGSMISKRNLEVITRHENRIKQPKRK